MNDVEYVTNMEHLCIHAECKKIIIHQRRTVMYDAQ